MHHLQPHIVNKKKSKRKKDKESGVARGIDFQFVSNIVNFDFPLDVNSYIHRAGRTARGKNQGTALSFVAIRERPLMESVEEQLKHTYNRDSLFKTYQFKLEEVEGFRYLFSWSHHINSLLDIVNCQLIAIISAIAQRMLGRRSLESLFERHG